MATDDPLEHEIHSTISIHPEDLLLFLEEPEVAARFLVHLAAHITPSPEAQLKLFVLIPYLLIGDASAPGKFDDNRKAVETLGALFAERAKEIHLAHIRTDLN